jgi:WD40 repeat protein
VSGSEDGNLLIWDVATETAATQIHAPHPRINTVSWNSLTDQIAFGTNSAFVYIWDMSAAEPLKVQGEHGENRDNPSSPEVAVVAYSPDGRWLASAAPDYMINLWSTEDPEIVRMLGPLERAVFSLAWSGDSHKLAYNSDLAHVYDVESETTTSFECAANDIIGSVALSPDGQYLAAANVSEGMCLWDIETQTLMTDWPVLEAMNTSYVDVGKMAWHPDGRSLALVILRRHTEAGSEIREWFVEVWAMPGGGLLASMQSPITLSNIAWSPDGTHLAASDNDGLIHIWKQE